MALRLVGRPRRMAAVEPSSAPSAPLWCRWNPEHRRGAEGAENQVEIAGLREICAAHKNLAAFAVQRDFAQRLVVAPEIRGAHDNSAWDSAG